MVDSWTTAPTVETVRSRASDILERLDSAAHGRSVTLVAVTKGFGVEVARTAISAGLCDLGENYAQELQAKQTIIADGVDGGDPSEAAKTVRWHFIGGLQRNKIKRIAPSVHLWHTMDRSALLDEVAKRSPGAAVLIQVNTTSEPQKSGCKPDDALRLVDHGRQNGLSVIGLMTVGPTEPTADPRPSFEMLRQLGQTCEVTELSMGMSGDFEMAAACGATIVRVGSALFGRRPTI